MQDSRADPLVLQMLPDRVTWFKVRCGDLAHVRPMLVVVQQGVPVGGPSGRCRQRWAFQVRQQAHLEKDLGRSRKPGELLQTCTQGMLAAEGFQDGHHCVQDVLALLMLQHVPA